VVFIILCVCVYLVCGSLCSPPLASSRDIRSPVDIYIVCLCVHVHVHVHVCGHVCVCVCGKGVVYAYEAYEAK
jgi:hypothetical protein